MKPYGVAVLIFVLQVTIVNTLSKHPLLLVVSFDGFWSGYMQKYPNATTVMTDFARKGVSTPWMENVFVTKTFPNHFSIATGLYEESHGIVANQFYDPVLNETFGFDNVEPKWWDTGAVPIWVLNQMKDPSRHSGGMMWPGTNARIKNQTAFHFMPYSPSKDNWKHKIDTVMSWFNNDTHPANCVFMYFEEPDATGHLVGPNAPEIEQAVALADKTVGYLLDQLKLAKLESIMNIIILSDHGMAEIKPDNLIHMDHLMNSTDYVKYGTSPIWAIYPNKGKEDKVYNALKDATSGFQVEVYKKADIPFHDHYKNNRRIPPILLVAKDGYELVDKEMNLTHPIGNHGYNTSVPSMHALFMARGPAFQKGVVIKPFQNLDLYPLMCHILRLAPPPHNGSLSNTILMLDDPYGIQITNTWFIIICSVLGLCILTAIVAIAVKQSKWEQVGTTDHSHHMYRAKRPLHGPNAGEENTYLLVPGATDEV